MACTEPIHGALAKPVKGAAKRKKRTRRLSAERHFRSLVWSLGGGVDRFTGQLLFIAHADPNKRGQVCHLKGRRVMPEWRLDPNRAVLLSDANHQLSDARGNHRLKLTDPETGEPATDARKPIKFTLRDKDGFVIRECIS
jgi:hypothetical protein